MITYGRLFNTYQQYLVDINNHIEKKSDTSISCITNNSRKLLKNGIFFSINEKAISYLKEVVKKEPSFIVIDIGFKKHEIVQNIIQKYEAPILFSEGINIRQLYSLFIVMFYQINLLPLKIVAITGTNGKTSSAYFYKQLCNFAGISACSIGTIGVISGDQFDKTNFSLTTPDIQEICEVISEKAKNGIFDFAIEASSHGLDQYRLDSLPINVATFTNFTQDHLDYHKNMIQYWNAKKRLFTEIIGQEGKVVINNDDEKALEIKEICLERGMQYVTYGIKNESDIEIISSKLSERYTQLIEFSIYDKTYSCEINILGEFQLYNLMAAISSFYCIYPEKIDLLFVNDGGGKINNLQAPPGRMEIIHLQNNSIGIIDYAHSPDGLENLLLSVKKLAKDDEKILLIFGCGGDRDKEKRSLMGEVAEEYSDYLILTDDNPRFEDPDLIRNDIKSGIIDHTKIKEIPSREKAILHGVQMSNQYKFIVIAGKGHENIQIIGNSIIEFNDKQILEKLIVQ